MKKILVLFALLLLTSCVSFLEEPATEKDYPKKIEQTVRLVDYVDPKNPESGNRIRLMGESRNNDVVYEDGKVAWYWLVTDYEDIYISDYGTAEEIKKLKCKRYNDIKKEIATLEDLNKPCK